MSSAPAVGDTPTTASAAKDEGLEPGVGLTGKKSAFSGKAGWLTRITLLVLTLLWTVPSIGLLISSFRERDAINSTGWWTVFASPLDFTQWTVENYHEVLFTRGGGAFGNAFVNSLVVAVPSTVIPITIAAFAAYAFSWMSFRGREVMFVTVVALLVVPLHVAFIPMIRLYGQLGISNSFLGLWIAHTGFGMPLAVYILKNYMGSLPSEVIESAQVDGASHFQIFWRLIVPLSIPALAAFAIFQFLWTWNDLLVALVFLGTQQDVQVVTVALANLRGSRGELWHLLIPGAFVTIIVPLIVFFSLQRYFVRGLTAGSVKG